MLKNNLHQVMYFVVVRTSNAASALLLFTTKNLIIPLFCKLKITCELLTNNLNNQDSSNTWFYVLNCLGRTQNQSTTLLSSSTEGSFYLVARIKSWGSGTWMIFSPKSRLCSRCTLVMTLELGSISLSQTKTSRMRRKKVRKELQALTRTKKLSHT